MENRISVPQDIIQAIEKYQAELLIVTKKRSIRSILDLYEAGYRHFGENRIQELLSKKPQLPEDIHWHFIGNLQRNKVKYIASFVYLIHSVENFKLLGEINKQAKKHQRIIPCLLEVHISSEKSKHGFDISQIQNLINNKTFSEWENIQIEGLMGMASKTEDEQCVREEFKTLKQLFVDLKTHLDLPNIDMTILSMGMSLDYHIALEEGSTMVRLGSVIFV